MVTSEPEKVGKKKRMQALTFFFSNPWPNQPQKKIREKKGSTGTATEPKVTASTKGYWDTPVAKKDDGPTALAPWNHESQGDPRGRETERKTHGQRKGFIWKNCVVKTELWNLEEIVNLGCRTLRWYANLRIREMRWRKGDGWT